MINFKKNNFLELNTFHTFLFLILITLIRIILLYLTPLGLSVDEAQYWDWSKKLEFGYFSKPPLISWLIYSTTFFLGEAEWAIRFSSPILHLGISLIIWLIAKKIYGYRAANISAIIWVTLPLTSLGSFIISTDTPLLFFWCVAFYSLIRLFETKSLFWPVVLGISLGLGFLTKYAVLFFIIGLFLLSLNKVILKGHSYKIFLSFCIFLLIIIPNIYWNIFNNLSTFNHTVYNADLKSVEFNIIQGLKFIASQFIIIGPFLFTLYFFKIFKLNSLRQNEFFLIYFSLPIFIIITIQAFLKTSNANWAATALPTTIVLISGLIMQRSFFLNVFVKLGIISNLLILIFFIKVYLGGNIYPVTLSSDPLRKLKGYSEHSKEILKLINSEKPSAILFTRRNDISKFSYYLKVQKDIDIKRFILTSRINPINHYEYKYNFKKNNLKKGQIVFVINNYNGISDKHIGYFNELKLLKKLQFQESKKRMRVFYIMRAIIK